jgi:hypothetical protein
MSNRMRPSSKDSSSAKLELEATDFFRALGLSKIVPLHTEQIERAILAFLFLKETNVFSDSLDAVEGCGAISMGTEKVATTLNGKPVAGDIRDFINTDDVDNLNPVSINKLIPEVLPVVTELIARFTPNGSNHIGCDWILRFLEELPWNVDSCFKGKVAIQLWLPVFFCSIVDKDEKRANKAHQDLANRIRPWFSERSPFTYAQCWQYYEWARIAWSDLHLGFAHTFHIYARCTDAATEKSPIPMSDYLIKAFGKNHESLLPLLSSAPFSRLCRTIIDDDLPVDYRDFARQRFTKFGFIVPPEVAREQVITPDLVMPLATRSKKRELKPDPRWVELANLEWSTGPFTFEGDYEKIAGHSAWEKMRQSIEDAADNILKDIRTDKNDETPLTTKLVERVDALECPEIVKALVARDVVCWCAARHRNKDRIEVILGHPARPPRRKPRRKSSKGEESPLLVTLPDTREHFNGCLRFWGLTGLKFAQGLDSPLWKEDERAYTRKRLPA